MMVVTLFFFTAYLACQLGGAIHGSGAHRENLTDEQAQTALRFWFFCEVFYTISTSIFKIAVGLFLLRITIVPLHIWIIRFIMAVAAFVGVAYTLLVLFQCRPMSFWWDLNPNHHGTCLSASLVMYFTYCVSALNSVADWTFGLLPIFVVKDLQMKRRVKVIVSGIIGLAAMYVLSHPSDNSLTNFHQWLNSNHHPPPLHFNPQTLQRRLPLPHHRLCHLDDRRSRCRDNSRLHRHSKAALQSRSRLDRRTLQHAMVQDTQRTLENRRQLRNPASPGRPAARRRAHRSDDDRHRRAREQQR